MTLRSAIAACVCLGWLFVSSARAQAPELTPSGYINDFAGVLSPQAKSRLEALAAELKQKTGAEVAVAIVPSLEGDTVENFANQLAESWGVGDQEDRGALLLLAIEDRGLRHCALVAAPYGDDVSLGVLGVIGPSRMDYGHVIPLVDYCSRLVGERLGSAENSAK